MNRDRNILLLSSLTTIFFFSMTKSSFPILMPELIRTMGFSYKTASTIFSAMSISGSVTSFFIGYLLERFDVKKVIFVFLLISISGIISFALSPRYVYLLISSFLIGVGFSCLFIVANGMSPRIYPEKSSNIVTSLHFTYTFGALLIPLLIPVILNFISWRFLIFLLSLFFVLLFFLYRKANLSLVFEKNEKRLSFKDIINCLKDKVVIYYCFLLFTYLCVELSIINWVVLFFTDAGVEYSKASSFLSVFFLFMLAGRLVWTFYSVKFNIYYSSVILFVITLVLFVFGVLLKNGYIIAACGITMSAVAPNIYNMFFNDLKKTIVVAFGFIVSISAFGEAFSSTIIGILSDISGIFWGFSFIIFFIIAEILLFLLRKHVVGTVS